MNKRSLSWIFLALPLAPAVQAWAQAGYDSLTPAARSELDRLPAGDRLRLGRELSQDDEKAGGNELLCTRWGCAGGALKLGGADWRGSPDGAISGQSFGGQANTGLFGGVESAMPVPGLQDYGIGAQAYAGFGVYKLSGRFPSDLFAQTNTAVQRQQLYSVGLFRRPDLSGPWYSRFGLGLVHDFSLNANASEYAVYYNLEQWRAKASYELTEAHEVGVWSAMHSGAAVATTHPSFLGARQTVYFRPIDQLNLFYKYNLPRGGNAQVYAGPGVGSHYPLSGPFSPIENPPYGGLSWTFGASCDLPVSDYVGVFAGLAYGLPRADADAAFSSSIMRNAMAVYSGQAGVKLFWGGNGKTRDDTGRRWMPYLPAPDNGNFAVQSSAPF